MKSSDFRYFALALSTGLLLAAAPTRGLWLDRAFGPAQGGLQIGLYPDVGPYRPDSQIAISVATRNVSNAPVAVPSASKITTLTIDDTSGRTLGPARELRCLRWIAVDNGSVVAPGAVRLEVASLDLQCYIVGPGRYRVTALARIRGLAGEDSAPAINLRSNTIDIAIPDPACHEPAKIVKVMQPDFPDLAKPVYGTSVIKVSLNDQGSVISASVYDSSGSNVLDRAALRAALSSTYSKAGPHCPSSFDFRAHFSGQ